MSVHAERQPLEHVIRVRTLATALQMMLDAAADDDAGSLKANAHAFELASMINDEADRIEHLLYKVTEVQPDKSL